MSTRQESLDDFLSRLRLTREHLGPKMDSGWTADHGSLKVNGRPLLGEHVSRHLDGLLVDAAAFADAVKDVPDGRLTEDRMTNVVRRQVQRHLTDWLVSEGNDPQHVEQAVRAFVLGFRIARAEELGPYMR
jgi:hypothetical protein